MEKIKIGNYDVIEFGKYNNQTLQWRVLDETDEKTLVIAEKGVGFCVFNSSGKAEWENSNIRNLLNSEFLNECFTEEEKERIIPTYKTQDRLFILGVKDIIKYLPDEKSRKLKADEDAFAKYKHYTGENSKKDPDGYVPWWTTSSVVFFPSLYVIESYGDYDTAVSPKSEAFYRPAMWIKK